MVMVEGRNNSLIMVFKTVLTQAMTLGLVDYISIADTDLQVVMMGQLYIVVNQLTNNSIVLDDKINSIGILKVKMPLIKRFSGEQGKLKGFLI
jgi:hypothetical protein